MNKLDIQFSHQPRFILVVILAAYLLCGSLFARLTPAWQMPDEPAHYNYIAHIANGNGLPVLSMGDFDMDYIGQIVGERFPSSLSVEPLRYEFYQPPLYYLSAVPIYHLADATSEGTEGVPYGKGLTALRFYGLMLGLLSLIFLYNCLSVAFPRRPLIALGATAFAATLPMHVAITAAVTNDTLAIMLLLASSLALLHWMRGILGDGHESPSISDWQERLLLLLLGVLLGLGLLTKIYAYAFAPICGLMVLLISWRQGTLRKAVVNVAWMALPALLLGLPLWMRNTSLYGLLDPLGLTWHDAVVVGQATTTEWIAENGWSAYWDRAIGFTFRSFWGVFGWLGLFWDWRFYTAVRILSVAIAAGLVALWASAFTKGRRRSLLEAGKGRRYVTHFHRWVTLFLVLTFVMVVVSYGFYNLKFVQHQGRYLFWGMLPISAAFGLGWRQLMHPNASLFAVLVLCGSILYTLILGERNPWTLLMHLVLISIFLLQLLLSFAANSGDNGEQDDGEIGLLRFIPDPIRARIADSPLSTLAPVAQPFIWAAPFIFLFLLCIVTIFGYVVPLLSA